MRCSLNFVIKQSILKYHTFLSKLQKVFVAEIKLQNFTITSNSSNIVLKFHLAFKSLTIAFSDATLSLFVQRQIDRIGDKGYEGEREGGLRTLLPRTSSSTHLPKPLLSLSLSGVARAIPRWLGKCPVRSKTLF